MRNGSGFMRKGFGALALGLAVMAAAPAAHAQWWNPFSKTQERLFNEKDYDTYFSPGLYRADSPTYNSIGLHTIKPGPNGAAGVSEGIDVMPKWDPANEKAFVKIRSAPNTPRADENMRWDARAKMYVYEITPGAFVAGQELIWLSDDDRLEITDKDQAKGTVRAYYREMIRGMGQDVAGWEALWEKQSIGRWTMQCFHVKLPKYDVECRSRGPGANLIVYRYKKQDQTS